MIDVVDELGQTPSYPLKRCDCVATGCILAIDSNRHLVLYKSTLDYVHWDDIQYAPGWNNGWPPGMGQSKGAVWKLVGIFGDNDASRKPISDDRAQKCDCGAAAADYNISRDGGPGHVDWCKVYNKGF